ncbi:hypothetical protein GCM10010166_63510 [Couchioplanes caeruleus subsp. azureus]|nr:hypothetical protein GCM10010166_63510 [Couchioplanes caeruleus subsp. azureus]
MVRSYLPLVPLWPTATPPAREVSTPRQDAEEPNRLDHLVAPWHAKFPEVPARTTVSHDSTAAVLTGVSHDAQLVVVGSKATV